MNHPKSVFQLSGVHYNYAMALIPLAFGFRSSVLRTGAALFLSRRKLSLGGLGWGSAEALDCGLNIGALIITYIVLGGPYF